LPQKQATLQENTNNDVAIAAKICVSVPALQLLLTFSCWVWGFSLPNLVGIFTEGCHLAGAASCDIAATSWPVRVKNSIAGLNLL
jgi:hypothetical protein